MRNVVLTMILAIGFGVFAAAGPTAGADPALNLLLKKGIITQEEYDQALKETGQAVEKPPAKAAPAPPATEASSPKSEPGTPAKAASSSKDADGDNTVDLGKGIKFGYDRGLYAQFKDTFKLKVRVRIQTRFTDSHFNTAYNNVGDPKNYPNVSSDGRTISPLLHGESLDLFAVHRLRLVLEGFAFNPDINYFVQLRSDTNDFTTTANSTRSTPQLFDAYLTFKQIPWANLRIGQYRTHFGRQQFVSTALLNTVDRGFVVEAFVPNTVERTNRDQGVTIFSDQEKYPINYAFGVFNGVGINITRWGLNSPGNANELMYVGRLTADLLGKPGYPEGDLKYSLTPQSAIGLSHGYNTGFQTNTTGPGSNNQISTSLASLGNGRLLNQGVVDIGTTGVDFVFKYRGYSLQAEGFVRNVDTRDHSKQIGNATGYYVQGGYFIFPSKFEVVGRYESMDPDTKLGHDLITSALGGLNWYFSGHENKLQFDYGVITTRLGGADVGGNVSLIENRARLQYTIVF